MIKIGSTFEGAVKDLSSDGRGVISHPTGRTFFVPGVWLHERGTFRVTGLKGRIGFAEILELSQESLHDARGQAQCQHHGYSEQHCGGCPWQFIAYEQQLEAKQARVHLAMSRLGVEPALQNIVPATQPMAYRNRAQFKTDGKKIGYLAAKSNTLVDIKSCPVLSTINQKTFAALRQQLPQSAWKPVKRKPWTSLDIDESVSAEHPSINARLPFQQANVDQNEFIRKWLAEILSTSTAQSAVELFCGSGNLTEVLAASKLANILAVEAVDSALEQLKAKKLPGVESQKCNLFSDSEFEKMAVQIKKAELLLLDPPRDGLCIRAPLFSKKSVLQEVIYISCDLATFSRDLRDFLDNGFVALEIQPLDMFPQTPHVEILAHLKKSKRG